MRLTKFVGTMGAAVPGMVGAHYHTAGSKAGDSGTPCLDSRGNLVGIRVGVFTDAEGEKRAVMINARQLFNYMVVANSYSSSSYMSAHASLGHPDTILINALNP